MKRSVVVTLLLSLTIILFLILARCNENKKRNNKNEIYYSLDSLFNEDKKDIFNTLSVNSDTLNLYAFISDCGEFGGHKEVIRIYSKEIEHRYILNYKRYYSNCDSIGRYLLHDKVEFEMNIKLTDKNKKSIFSYIQKLLELKLNQQFYSNANNTFSVYKSDSTLVISVSDVDERKLENYNKLIKNLNISKFKGKYNEKTPSP
jgi:hypothetical protein